MSVTLFYAHDPMCSWCWAFSPVYNALIKALPGNVQVTRLLGGLAADNDQPMPDNTRSYIQGQWQKIRQVVPGTEFNFAFWDKCQPRRSTWPACRAIIAARQQGLEFDQLMTAGIQKAYYLDARNPSEVSTLITIAGEIGVNTSQFKRDVSSAATEETLQAEMEVCRSLGLYGYPGLLLQKEDSQIPIDIDYLEPATILRQIEKYIV